MNWDRELYSKLFHEMKTYCLNCRSESKIDRDIAAVFWNASWWVKQQVEGIENLNTEYHQNAITNLDHLAWALFENQERTENEYEPI